MNEPSPQAWAAAKLIDEVVQEFLEENGMKRVTRSPPRILANIVQAAIDQAMEANARVN